MRVKAGPSARTGSFAQEEYVVLGLVVKPSGAVQFIVDEHGGAPLLYPLGEVVITDGRLPSSWRATITSEGQLDLEPEEWTGNFWEKLEDDDAAAWETYRRVKKRLEAESR